MSGFFMLKNIVEKHKYRDHFNRKVRKAIDKALRTLRLYKIL